MLQAVLFIVVYILVTTVLGTTAIVIGIVDLRGKMIAKLARLWAMILLVVSGIRYRVTGLEYLDRRENYIFASNHESSFDVPLVFGLLPYHIVSIAKIELKKVPILGWAMMGARHIFVDRHDSNRAVVSLKEASNSLARNPRSIILFPEGTRSPDGEIHQFKKGGLGLALDLGMAVVPVAQCGTRDVLAKKSLWLKEGEVEMRLGRPIDPSLWQGKSKKEFADHVRTEVVSLKNGWLADNAPQSGTATA
ncbi:MAG: lysophospholipid acyltransferase family protein [Candidatus Marinimicrobia bacterium]|nr:hypothetical protein [Candidatus Neomarinimicrobiota bacterium]MDP6456386.1 lysophospholipid acyltransferase family protein [Candidatus Neomarinimicrobiota bacterium]MDP6593670.1 lysophospholipid acyltransferase family protein [Candidatus Neomarinimicrobiota bacterium]MDP6836220.1 lysophospholipid acyltransferase family protein [Candidatus Neomarinimicrobiota bacterium]